MYMWSIISPHAVSLTLNVSSPITLQFIPPKAPNVGSVILFIGAKFEFIVENTDGRFGSTVEFNVLMFDSTVVTLGTTPEPLAVPPIVGPNAVFLRE